MHGIDGHQSHEHFCQIDQPRLITVNESHGTLDCKNSSLIAAMSSGMAIVRPGPWFSPRSRDAPHDGFRWWIVSNVVSGLRGKSRVPTVFTRSINLRPVGTSLPARPARIQFRQWPPVSIDIRSRFSRGLA